VVKPLPIRSRLTGCPDRAEHSHRLPPNRVQDLAWRPRQADPTGHEQAVKLVGAHVEALTDPLARSWRPNYASE
jgi:hypothetical protein